MRLRPLLKKTAVIISALLLLLVLAVLFAIHYTSTLIPDYVPTDKTVYLDQGWGTEADSPARQTYYYTPQGTSLKGMEYNWLAHLEMPWGKDKFAKPEHLKAYGFIVDDKPTAMNPYQYPLGFTKHYDKRTNSELLDLSCATCHNGQLNFQKDGKRLAVRIDGGQAMHAFTTMKLGNFVPTMIASMASTYLNPFKFDRFAQNVLAEAYDSENKSQLRKKFGMVLMRFLSQGFNDKSKGLYPIEEGFGRTDALARIGNTVFGDNLADKNYHVATGPVNYPPVWNIWKFDWVQYGASVKQPMARNMGEALGVGAHIQFTDEYGNPLPAEERFDSSVLPEEIFKIESTLQALKPPAWPEEIFGAIDYDKAQNGKVLFKQHCMGCHGPHPANEMIKQIDAPLKTAEQPVWVMTGIPVEDIGTDANAAYNFLYNQFDLRKTGLSDAEIRSIVRKMNVRNFERLASVALKSDRLAQFLQQPSPQANQLKTQTAWVDLNQQHYQPLLKTLQHWQSKYSGIAQLAQTIASMGDDQVQQDIKTQLIKDLLENLDQSLAGLRVDQLTVGEALNITGIIIREKYYQDKNFSAEKQACLDGYGALDLPQQKMIYKARPLEGIWATPPFLHNGSVPSIYQLLSPVSERDVSFYVSLTDFDPTHLGYITTGEVNEGFLFDTQIEGNRNTGHEFRAGYIPYQPGNPPQYGVIGPALSHQQRMEIIEYLKIHKDSPVDMVNDNSPSDLYQQCLAL
ncbi:di-heme-cytochrome C peroxidase [Thalassotalea ganghwensis]